MHASAPAKSQTQRQNEKGRPQATLLHGCSGQEWRVVRTDLHVGLGKDPHARVWISRDVGHDLSQYNLPPMYQRLLGISIIVVGILATAAFFLWKGGPPSPRAAQVFAWIKDPPSRRDIVIAAGSHCGNAPFIFPTTGVVGFLWDDSFRVGHRHQGIDIFAGTPIDVTPVVAAYPGYLTRLADWKSSVIVRVPSDPLRPGQQIWVYYTHMADANGKSFISADFPPGTSEKPVQAGTQLGRQGDYSGDPNNPVGVHLHVSIVKDYSGNFTNELDINNTYDPSPYYGLALNARQNPDKIPVCESTAN
jgi:hypothetical protein